MLNRKFGLACLLISGGTSIAIACGPDFPTQLLDDRAGNLKAAPANSFEYEAMHLIPKTDDVLKPVEPIVHWYNTNRDHAERLAAFTKIEGEGLTEPEKDRLWSIRTSHSGDAAYTAGLGLPEEVRLYAAGAVDFQVGQWKQANAHFQAVLALSEPNRRTRAVWAAYMLGRSFGKLGDIINASFAFQLTRDLVINGTADPLGLAVASFGEEAKLHLDLAEQVLVDGHLPSSAEFVAKYTHELGIAVALYANQAAHGSNSGVQSLRIVAETLLGDTGRLSASITDSTVQRLLVAYVLARVDDIPEAMPARPDQLSNSFGAIRPITRPNPILLELIKAVRMRGIEHPAGGDRLAALAYRTGQYALAQKLAEGASSPLGDWVQAKIALQKGDLATAATYYSRATKGFPINTPSSALDDHNIKLSIGESGVLALARGEYVSALDFLFTVGSAYWGDVAYIAERVLTVDELKTFVDSRVPKVITIAPEISSDCGDTWDDFSWRFTADPSNELRDLLARRLVREGRYQEAIGYFPEQRLVHQEGRYHEEPNYVYLKCGMKLVPDDVSRRVARYAASMKTTESSVYRMARARAWYEAARLARHSGMEMMGYEGPPDFFAVDGEYGGEEYWAPIGRQRVDGPLVTEGEQQRFLESKAIPAKRFHYRYIAVEEAVRSADLLPPRSQAFAAVLCNAASWVIDRDQVMGQELYKRYVKEGPYVPWAKHFARTCPEPDFDGAAKLRWLLPWRDARHFVSRYRWPIGTISVLIAAVLASRFFLRSRGV